VVKGRRGEGRSGLSKKEEEKDLCEGESGFYLTVLQKFSGDAKIV
jgi:hypothetical protein